MIDQTKSRYSPVRNTTWKLQKIRKYLDKMAPTKIGDVFQIHVATTRDPFKAWSDPFANFGHAFPLFPLVVVHATYTVADDDQVTLALPFFFSTCRHITFFFFSHVSARSIFYLFGFRSPPLCLGHALSLIPDDNNSHLMNLEANRNPKGINQHKECRAPLSSHINAPLIRSLNSAKG